MAVAGLSRSEAQVVLDGKFGTSGAVAGPNFNITAGMGAVRGNNLFHSFTQFDLKTGDVAAFSGPANIKNIMSRVTGGSPSSINGTIRSDIAGANFFFINPKGILFGPNAMVDVTGAFAASTANYLKLADGARFVAALDADDSMLSTSPVAAFGFLDGANGAIDVSGALKASPGTTLSVVGSTVSVTEGARLEAISGQINLTGVSAPGEVGYASSPSLAAASGISPPSAMTSAAGSGDIVIRGGKLVVDNATISAGTSGGDIDIVLSKSLEVVNGGQITTSSSGVIKGGNITINSSSVVVDGLDTGLPTRIAAETSSDNILGAGGNVVVRSDSLELRGGAEISVSTSGAADAGRVDITTGLLSVLGFPTQITANAAPISGINFGAGGRIVIHAQNVEIGEFGTISATTLGNGNAGFIDITAGSLTLKDGVISTYSGGAGNGGDIRIQSDHLTLNGAYSSVAAQATSSGNGGVINITGGTVQLLNDSAISASTFGKGKGGSVTITADSIVLNQATAQPGGATPGISASSNPSAFVGQSGGNGGDVSIAAGSLTLQNGMLISATTSTAGDGGNINITAGTVTLDNKSSIQSASLDSGRAGTITLHSSQDVLLSGNSSISTSALKSSGGNINVTAGNEIQLADSRITAQVELCFNATH